MNYSLRYTGFIQPSLNRYAVLATAYTDAKLSAAMATFKGTLLNVLNVLDGFDGVVKLRLVDDKELRVDIVFDYGAGDVYLSAERLANAEHVWTATVFRGVDGASAVDLAMVDGEWFAQCVRKPLLLMVIMHHQAIVKFIDDSVAQVVETERHVNALAAVVEAQRPAGPDEEPTNV